VIKNNAGTILDNLFYIYTDHLNTPREIRNHNNQQRWTWYPETAEAFGANPPNDNPSALGAFAFNLRFPGQLYDPTTQLSYNYYRDYNPRTGRYPTSDPIGLAGGINTYAYVDNDPIHFTDPYGLCKRAPCFWDGMGMPPRGAGGHGSGMTTPTRGSDASSRGLSKGNLKTADQLAKDATRMSGNELDKACKNNGYKDAHDLKKDFGLDRRWDIFVDKNGQLYSGPRQGSGTPQPLNINKSGAIN
jgi:RHS repeat-associated protein